MILKLIIQRLKMVLREFSEDELEMFFTDKHLRQVLIMLIQEYGNSLSSDAIINLALQNLLGDLQMSNDPQTILDETEECYIMSHYSFIEKYILNEKIIFEEKRPLTVTEDMLDIDFEENREFVEKIIGNDGKRCVCGGEENLEVHNSLPLNQYPEIGLDERAVFPICRDCHEKYHSRYHENDVMPLTFLKFMEAGKNSNF